MMRWHAVTITPLGDGALGWSCACGGGGKAQGRDRLADRIRCHAPDLADRVRSGEAPWMSELVAEALDVIHDAAMVTR